MANVQQNSTQRKEFTDYLLASGFTERPGPNFTWYEKGDLTVLFIGHTADFMRKNKTGLGHQVVGSANGLDGLDLFGWQLILHAYNIVSLKELIHAGMVAEYPSISRHTESRIDLAAHVARMFDPLNANNLIPVR